MSGFANAIMAAAFIAAAVTLLSVPTAQVINASPRPQAEADAMQACAARPWPYLRCAGTAFGNPRVRLVSTERLTP